MSHTAAAEYSRRAAAADRERKSTKPHPKESDVTTKPAPAESNPALAVACPHCGTAPGDLCTSHGGARVRWAWPGPAPLPADAPVDDTARAAWLDGYRFALVNFTDEPVQADRARYLAEENT
jgi:hypothetical protein